MGIEVPNEEEVRKFSFAVWVSPMHTMQYELFSMYIKEVLLTEKDNHSKITINGLLPNQKTYKGIRISYSLKCEHPEKQISLRKTKRKI